MEDISKCVTPDFKEAGDDVYMVGMTCPELGGSEYFDMLGATGNNVPKVNAEKALALYKAMEKMIHADIPSSIITPSLGGLGVAAAKAAMGGRVGLVLDLAKVPQEKGMSDLEVLFSESNSRFLISCKPEKSAELEKALQNGRHARQLQIHTRRSLILFQRFPTPFPKKRERRFYMIFSVSRFSRKVEKTNGCDISAVSLFIT